MTLSLVPLDCQTTYKILESVRKIELLQFVCLPNCTSISTVAYGVSTNCHAGNAASAEHTTHAQVGIHTFDLETRFWEDVPRSLEPPDHLANY